MGSTRIAVNIPNDPDVAVRDEAPPTGNAHYVAVVLDADVELRFGRFGATSDEHIVSIADRLIAAVTEIREHAAMRLTARSHFRPGSAADVVCQSPVCPVSGTTHFTGGPGCSTTVYRTATAS